MTNWTVHWPLATRGKPGCPVCRTLLGSQDPGIFFCPACDWEGDLLGRCSLCKAPTVVNELCGFCRAPLAPKPAKPAIVIWPFW